MSRKTSAATGNRDSRRVADYAATQKSALGRDLGGDRGRTRASRRCRGEGRIPRRARSRRDRARPVDRGVIRCWTGHVFDRGPKEARAWTMTSAPRDRKPPAAYTAISRRLHRCKTIAYDEYVACDGEPGAKEAGKMRLEGEDYVVQDGDVMHSVSTSDDCSVSAKHFDAASATLRGIDLRSGSTGRVQHIRPRRNRVR